MSTHDEASAPLDDLKTGDETGEGVSGEVSSAPETEPSAGGESISAALEEKLRGARAALEQKDWQSLADVLALDAITIEGHPEPVSLLVSRLNSLTGNLSDFEGVLLRVSRREIDADRARFSFRFRVMWNSSDDWEEHDFYIDAHIGFHREEQGWKAAYLSLSRAYPAAEQPAKPVVQAAPAPGPSKTVPPAPKTSEPPPKVKRAAAKPPVRAAAPPRRVPPPEVPAPKPLPKIVDQPLTEDYFSQAAAQYFGQVAGGDKGEPAERMKLPAIGSSVGGRHHLLYVPVVMHEDLIKKILGNE